MRTWRWARMASVGLQMILYLGALGPAPARAQGLGGAGTVQGTVKDPTGGVMVAVTVDLSNPVTGFKRSATTDAAGGSAGITRSITMASSREGATRWS